MENNKEKISKLSQEGEKNISGGYIIKAHPEDLKQLHLDFKPYLVIQPGTNRILNSYDTEKEAKLADYGYKGRYNSYLDKGELKDRIYINANGDIRYIDS